MIKGTAMQNTNLNFDRITFDDQLIIGQACIRHMAMPVALIVNLVAHGMQAEDIIEIYPCLEKEDIELALAYTTWLVSRRVYPHKN
jgi:uncharacterized protein (DUF433 family)